MSVIFFATNRDVRFMTSKNGNNFGKRFNEGGPQMFRLGKVEVKLTGDPLDDDAWDVGRCEIYPETLDSSMPGGAKLGSAAMFEDLRQILKNNGKDVIIYLHGFANDFPNSVKRAAALQRLYSGGSRPVEVVSVKGFSTKTCLPASAAAAISSACAECGIASTTPSIAGSASTSA